MKAIQLVYICDIYKANTSSCAILFFLEFISFSIDVIVKYGFLLFILNSATVMCICMVLAI